MMPKQFSLYAAIRVSQIPGDPVTPSKMSLPPPSRFEYRLVFAYTYGNKHKYKYCHKQIVICLWQINMLETSSSWREVVMWLLLLVLVLFTEQLSRVSKRVLKSYDVTASKMQIVIPTSQLQVLQCMHCKLKWTDLSVLANMFSQ